MKQFLLFISVLLLPLMILGQGAATPVAAWNSGVPNQHWFMLDQDIKTTTSWEFRSDYYTPPGGSYNINTDPRNIELNNSNLFLLNSGNFPRVTYDVYNQTACGLPNFEEWYIIKVPSNSYINIELSVDITDLVNNPTNTYLFTSLILFGFDVETDLNSINLCNTTPSANLYDYSGSMINSTANPLKVNLANYGNDYIALRIGNNAFGPFGTVGEFGLNITTMNNSCDKAIKAPVSLEGFNSTTSSDSLVSDSELSNAYYTARSGNVTTGNNDLNIPSNTGTNGMWFHVENISDDPVYAALCNVSQNAQMVIYKDIGACPALDVSDDADHIVGAEDQNTDDNGNGGVDVCLIGTNSTDNPVMRIDAPASSYYIYLFGDHGGADFDFDFYFLNSSGTELGGGGILPVEWILFNGKAEGSYNRLEWVTGSEQQNDYFSVEKSKDGENYTELAKVEGAGNSAFENNYSIIDPFSYPLTYYRISQVDWDGTIHSGPQTVVENHNAITNFQVLTNPVETNSIRLSYYITKEENIQIELYSLNGVSVYSEKNLLSKYKSELNIPITNLKSGMYLLSIKTAYKNYTQKIIISNNQ